MDFVMYASPLTLPIYARTLAGYEPGAVLYYSKQAAAAVCAVIFQQWQIQSNFSSYVTLFLGGIV